jgi:SAM-dependent methyltransferase
MSARPIESPSREYDEDYFAHESGYSKMFLKGNKPFYHRRWVRELSRYQQSGRLLDMGCGMGYFAKEASNRWDVLGIDISVHGIKSARKRCPRGRFEAADLLNWKPPAESFEVITCFDIVEHFENPQKVLRIAFDALSYGGVLGLTTPNPDSIGKIMKENEWFGYRDSTHVSIKKPEQWFKVLKSIGFSIEKEFYDGLWDSPYLRGWPAFLQHMRYKIPQAVLFGMGRDFPRNRGENLCLIAVKGRRQ